MGVLCTHLPDATHQCVSVWELKHIPAAPLGWAHRWYHLIDALFGCQWRRSNSIMPWSKPPLSALQFACTLQSHCAAYKSARTDTHAGRTILRNTACSPNKTRSKQQEAMLSGKFLKSYIIKSTMWERLRLASWRLAKQSLLHKGQGNELSHVSNPPVQHPMAKKIN